MNLEKINFCDTEERIKKDLTYMSRNEKRRFKKAILKKDIFVNLAIELNFIFNFINKKEIQNEFIKFLSDNYHISDKKSLNINAYFNFFNKKSAYFNWIK